jgi:hypothetical protein
MNKLFIKIMLPELFVRCPIPGGIPPERKL